MKDRKVFQAIMMLSVYELNSFEKYLLSPYFNKSVAVIDLFKVIAKSIKEKQTDELTSEQCWVAVYGATTYSNTKFLRLTSELSKLLEDFIGQKEFDKSPSTHLTFKIKGVQARKMNMLYNTILSEKNRLSKQEFNQSAEYYLSKYQMEVQIFNLQSETEKKNLKYEIDANLNLHEISENLDIFFIAEKLKRYGIFLGWKKLYTLGKSLSHVEFAMECAQKTPYNLYPPVRIYYRMINTYLHEEDTENYFELRADVKQYIHFFPLNEQHEIYNALLSFCINKSNKHQVEFYKELFDLYNEGINLGVLIDNKSLTVTDFRNIVLIALRVQEFAWAENFIQEYAIMIDEKYRENAVNFSSARVEFYRKNYSKVIEYLNNVNYEDVWYNLNSKTLYLHTYYELDEFDPLESLLQSFKVFIRRENSLSDARKLHYLNLISFTSTLVRTNVRDKKALQKLKHQVEQTEGIVSKQWLLDKINDLL